MAKIAAEWLDDGLYEEEVPTGLVNGVNTVFTLSSAPHSAKSVSIYLNGLLQRQSTDYSVSGTTVTFVTAPATAQRVLAKYTK
jgi:hypothetical protein